MVKYRTLKPELTMSLFILSLVTFGTLFLVNLVLPFTMGVRSGVARVQRDLDKGAIKLPFQWVSNNGWSIARAILLADVSFGLLLLLHMLFQLTVGAMGGACATAAMLFAMLLLVVVDVRYLR